jgi:hypothetical protein
MPLVAFFQLCVPFRAEWVNALRELPPTILIVHCTLKHGDVLQRIQYVSTSTASPNRPLPFADCILMTGALEQSLQAIL